MYHPGGFGNSNSRHDLPPYKREPSLTKAVFFLVGMLIFWVLCFVTGLKLGMGWYAWPIGTSLLFLVFFAYNLWQFRRFSRRKASFKTFS
ncbi:MAG: hypothetical protein CMI24_09740 [Opitutae bacterium]|nr:hypothetical protein [Opitutae bacterium]